MRWVFYLLICANIALLVWRFGIGLPAQYSLKSTPVTWEQPTNIKKVLLLGESADSANSRDGASLEALCHWVGPFDNQASAQIFIERIAALDVFSALKQEKSVTGQTYWVYLQQFGERAEAKDKLAELQYKGIDSFIITKGELENAISLGVFSELKLAQKRLSEVVVLGYEPKIKSMERSVAQFWVSVEETEVQKIGENTWRKIVDEQFRLSEKQKFCLDVASR